MPVKKKTTASEKRSVPSVAVESQIEKPAVDTQPVSSDTLSSAVSSETSESTEPAMPVTPVMPQPQADRIPPVATPQVETEPTGSSGKIWLLSTILVILLIALGFVGYFLWKIESKKNLFSFSKPVSITPTIVPTKPPPPIPTVTVDLSKYTIAVLNGSGSAGVAAKARNTLNAAGFTVSTVGNASTSDFTKTVVAAKTTVDSAYVNKLMQVLSNSYTVSSSMITLNSSKTTDVVVTIGSETK